MKKPVKAKQFKQRKVHLISVVVIVLVAVLVVFELSPFGGNVRFYAKWVECGKKPVASDISIGLGAKVTHYIEPESFEPIRLGQPEYFCTPLEAEMAGYSANPNSYEFPHIQSES